MANQVGMGVVGAGAIGINAALKHLSQEDVKNRVRLTAVCDPVEGRAEAAAAAYGVDRGYRDYEALLADPAVDAVTICTPIGMHFTQGMMALEAGKHIHFNKTMTTTRAEADTLIAAAEAKNLKIVASPGQMYWTANQRMRKLLLDGELGRPVWAIAGTGSVGNYHINEPYRHGNDILTNTNPSWYFKKPGGGPQYDVTVYCLHALTGIVGPVRRVSAASGKIVASFDFRGERIANEMDDSTTLLLEFDNSLVGVVYASPVGLVADGFSPHLYGLAGKVEELKFNGEPLGKPGDRMPHHFGEHGKMGENHVYEDIMQLVDWISGTGRKPLCNAEHARHVIDIIESGYRAAETGQAQTICTDFDLLGLGEINEMLEQYGG